MSIISRNYGWYLARITASIENFKNIVATDLDTIKKYNLTPGRYIRIVSLSRTKPFNKAVYKFIILPYFKEFIKNYWLLKNIIQSLIEIKSSYVDDDYIRKLTKLMINFYQLKNNKKGLRLNELFEFDELEQKYLNIAVPESWLNENCIELGETILLRNDMPSPQFH